MALISHLFNCITSQKQQVTSYCSSQENNSRVQTAHLLRGRKAGWGEGERRAELSGLDAEASEEPKQEVETDGGREREREYKTKEHLKVAFIVNKHSKVSQSDRHTFIASTMAL